MSITWSSSSPASNGTIPRKVWTSLSIAGARTRRSRRSCDQLWTFITPFEREDIQALAASLYKIPKTVEKIGERILICPADLQGRNFQQHLELLDQAAEAVLAMVKELRKGIDAVSAREMNSRLQTIEGNADKLELDLLRDLYHGDYDPKQIIFLRDLFELLEKVIDRCRDAGNIILQVVLKYS